MGINISEECTAAIFKITLLPWNLMLHISHKHWYPFPTCDVTSQRKWSSYELSREPTISHNNSTSQAKRKRP